MKLLQVVLALGLLSTFPSRAFAAGFVDSENFVVLTPARPDQDSAQIFAEEILGKAEQFRKMIAKEWLGEELPPSVGRTVISVQMSDEKDKGLTWAKDHPSRKFHSVYLTTTRDGALGSTLAHEIAHVVLATQFPHPNRLPAWVEEGIASRYDDTGRLAKRRKILRWFSSTGSWPSVDAVLGAKNIDAADQSAYAVASSLAEFLLTKGDKTRFFKFAKAGLVEDWDRALSTYYGIRDVVRLQTAWQQWASGSGHAANRLAVLNPSR